MDSMRSLNTSLPVYPAPPEQLLQAFRTAALSVTNLYKSAVTDQNVSRQAGYQEALEDLLSFLDRENLGLQDGEGWRVRQWATERYDGSTHQQQNESDDEKSENGQRPRSVTPTREQPSEQPVSTVPPTPASTSAQAPANVESATQTEEYQSPQPVQDDCTPPATPIFHFIGNSTTNASSDDMQTDDTEHGTDGSPGSSSSPQNASIRVLNGRGSRTPHRHGNQRHAKSTNREFTFTAGTKRKFQIPDFFDISNIGPREGFGGNKKGRLS